MTEFIKNEIIGFNEKWNTDHIDEHLKNTILICNHRYTELLKIILENPLNQNVIINKDDLYGIVYNNKKNEYDKMSKDNIMEDVMNKLHEQLLKMVEDMDNSKFIFDESIIDIINHDIKNKYSGYKNSNKIRKDEINNVFFKIFYK